MGLLHGLLLIAAVFSLSIFTVFGQQVSDEDINDFNHLALKTNLPISDGAELNERLNNFEKTKAEIEELNSKNKGATFKINKFALMSENEKQRVFPGVDDEEVIMETREKRSAIDDTWSTSIPDSLDYRALGKVTPPKDQIGEICGSCWAHGAIGAIESQYLIRYNLSLDLSEQYVVNCENTYSYKCNGGSIKGGFILANQSGIPTENCEPYRAQNGTCSNKCDNQQKYYVTSYKWMGYNESNYAAYLYNYGPIALSFYTSDASMYYDSGVLEPSDACSFENNLSIHTILLVGYTKDYWIAKNSFGEDWGENGYFRFRRGVNWCNMTRSAWSVYVAPTNIPPPTNPPVTRNTTVDPSIIGCPNYDGITKMNNTWRNLVLNAFNEQRSQIANGLVSSFNGTAFPKAKNMRKLIYNCTIEAELQALTNSCQLNSQKSWEWFGSWPTLIYNRTAIDGLLLEGRIRGFAINRNITQISKQNNSTFIHTSQFFTVYDDTISMACWYVSRDKCYYNDGTRAGLYCGIYPIPNITGPIYETGLPCSRDNHCTKPNVNKCDASLGLCYPEPGCINGDGITKINQTWRDYALYVFNNKRAALAAGLMPMENGTLFPAAKIMKKLVYNCSIEAEAQRYAATCDFQIKRDWSLMTLAYMDFFKLNEADFYYMLKRHFEQRPTTTVINQNGSSFVYNSDFPAAFANAESFGCWYAYNNTCYAGLKTAVFCGIYPPPLTNKPLYEVGLPNPPTSPVINCPNYDGITKLNNSWRQRIVNLFNVKRAELAAGLIQMGNTTSFPPAKNMRKLVYNCSLELEAQKFSTTCYDPKGYYYWWTHAEIITLQNYDFNFWMQRSFENKENTKIVNQNGTLYVYSEKHGIAYDNLASIGCWFSYNNNNKCFNGTKTVLYCAIAPVTVSNVQLYEVGSPCSQNSHCTKPGVNKCDISLKLCYA